MSPVEELQPAWEKFKRTHAQTLRQVHLAYRHQEHVVMRYRMSQAENIHDDAKAEWNLECARVCGAGVRLEWLGTVDAPMCLVNGVMMFA